MTQRMVVSKEGFDALTETDPNNLIFDSSLNHLKTVQSGTLSVAYTAFGTPLSGDGTAFGTVTHNLGYLPMVLSFFRNQAIPSKTFITSSGNWGGARKSTPEMDVDFSVGTDIVVFRALGNEFSGTAAGTADIMYEIFYEGS